MVPDQVESALQRRVPPFWGFSTIGYLCSAIISPFILPFISLFIWIPSSIQYGSCQIFELGPKCSIDEWTWVYWAKLGCVFLIVYKSQQRWELKWPPIEKDEPWRHELHKLILLLIRELELVKVPARKLVEAHAIRSFILKMYQNECSVVSHVSSRFQVKAVETGFGKFETHDSWAMR